MGIKVSIKKFSELTIDELYSIIHLREKVFVVEQNAPYQNTDYKDQKAIHIMLWAKEDLVAYARVLPENVSYQEASIGRVVSAPKYRRKSMGKKLMEVALQVLEKELNTTKCRISAQSYLVPFYKNYGFEVCSEEYLEDGLPHYEMLKI